MRTCLGVIDASTRQGIPRFDRWNFLYGSEEWLSWLMGAARSEKAGFYRGLVEAITFTLHQPVSAKPVLTDDIALKVYAD